jgi:hypothetical protein
MTDTLHPILTAATGLLFRSESDYPFEPFTHENPSGGPLEVPQLLSWLSLPPNTPVQQQELAYFFRNHTRESPGASPAQTELAHRFQRLQAALEKDLRAPAAYCIGQTQVHAYLLGQDAAGNFAGLTTTLIQT